MNKKYFTKYLPVEGEIKAGDHFYYGPAVGYGVFIRKATKLEHTPTEEYPVASIVMGIHKDAKQHVRMGIPEPVKLFLCSRNIQVGDKVIYPITGELREVISKEKSYSLKAEDVEWRNNNKWCDITAVNQHVKVVGEISPDAIWVKEGDEFDENEIGIRLTNMHGKLLSGSYPFKKDRSKEFSRIAIKGPCGHFH